MIQLHLFDCKSVTRMRCKRMNPMSYLCPAWCGAARLLPKARGKRGKMPERCTSRSSLTTWEAPIAERKVDREKVVWINNRVETSALSYFRTQSNGRYTARVTRARAGRFVNSLGFHGFREGFLPQSPRPTGPKENKSKQSWKLKIFGCVYFHFAHNHWWTHEHRVPLWLAFAVCCRRELTGRLQGGPVHSVLLHLWTACNYINTIVFIAG